MGRFIVAIDQGTTSSRAILFNLSGKPIYSSQKEFRQYFPQDGWVEHKPNEIWSTTIKVLKDVISKSKKIKGKILTVGITNQRETTILWDKKLANLFTMPLSGKIEEQQVFVKNLKQKEKKSYLIKKLDC